MNILYITNHINTGGITSYVFTLGTGLRQKGHGTYIASSAGQNIDRFIEKNIVYIPIPIKTKKEISLKVLISMFRLLGIIKKYHIDIVHSNSRTTQVLGCLLHKFSGVPYVSTCHGFFKKRFLRKMFPCWGQKVIAISESVKEHLINDFKVKESDIRLIHNGINVEQFKIKNPELKKERKNNFGLKEGPVIGIVARLSDVKGHIYLVKAMKNVLVKIGDAQLVIVGEGRMKEELIALTKILGMEKSVFFLPEVPDTREVLSLMDIFVLPSLKEGLGLALMEAMASGLAVIGSSVGGIKSLIQDGHNGLLVGPGDIDGLSSAILGLLENPAKREFLGKNASIFISQNFSQEKMLQDTQRVYFECLSAEN